MASRTLPEMPCGPILELYGQRKRFHVPYGLKGLIEDMTREVLRHQPNNIYEFLATFMDERLQKKRLAQEQNKKRKSWEHHRWSWQGTSNLTNEELEEFMDTLQAPPEAAEHSALVIQSAFRGYQARKKVNEMRKTIHEDGETRKSLLEEEQAKRKSVPTTDQEPVQGEVPETKEVKRGSRVSGDAEFERTMRLSMDNATDAEQHAAVKIQAAFRGHMTRKIMDDQRKSKFQPVEHDADQQGQEAASIPTDAQQNQESELNQSELPKRQSDPGEPEPQKQESEVKMRLSDPQKRQAGSQPALNASETQVVARKSGSLSKRQSDPNNQAEPVPENQTEQQEPAVQGGEEA